LELDVATQIEFVGDVIQIALGFGLAREVLLPVPFFQQLLRKGVAVSPTFGIEAGTGIAVPVPGAADAGARFEHPRLEPEFAQLVELIEAGNPGADDDRVEIRARIRPRLVRGRLRVSHVLIPCTDACGNPNAKPHSQLRRSNRALSESRAAADSIARLSASRASASKSCECPAVVRISSSSHDGDRTGTDTSVIP